MIPTQVIRSPGSSKRPLVRVTLNGYIYRSAVAAMGGKFMVGVDAGNRRAAGVLGGEEKDVTLALDLDPRTVEPPDDLKAALHAAGVLQAFADSAPSTQKEFVQQVDEAKTQETRERRIARIVEKLAG